MDQFIVIVVATREST